MATSTAGLTVPTVDITSEGSTDFLPIGAEEIFTHTDLISGYNLLPFSSLLQKFLSAKSLEESFQRVKNKEASFIARALENEKVILPTGSYVEGFAVPQTVNLGENKRGENTEISDTDLDVMVIVNRDVFDFTQDKDGTLERWQILLEDDLNFPGYVHLRPYGAEEIWGSELLTYVKGKAYFSSESFKQLALRDTSMGVLNAASFTKDIVGPAIKTLYKKTEGWGKYCENEFDMVYAFEIKFWPNIAKTWQSRKRCFDWPSTKLVDAIVSGGCHIVNIGHPQSDHPYILFRLSFSLAERMLAHSVNMTQRQAYILLKILRTHAFLEPKVLSSYHLKNILFWACEELPMSFWNPDNLGKCLLYLIDRLIKCLVQGRIPNYFVEKNNLLAGRSRLHITTMCKKVVHMRKNVMAYLLDYNSVNRFHWGPIYTPFEESFKPMLCILFKTGISRKEFLVSQSEVTENLAFHFLSDMHQLEEEEEKLEPEQMKDIRKERFDKILSLLHKSWTLKRFYLQQVAGPFMEFFLQKLEGYKISKALVIRFLLFVESSIEKKQMAMNLYWYLGIVFHRLSTKIKPDEDQDGSIREETETNAGISFTKAMDLDKVTPPICVDFGNFLCQTKQFQYALDPLLKTIELDGETMNDINLYSQKDIGIVGDHISHILETGSSLFRIHSVIHAHFLLAKCYRVLEKNNPDKSLLPMNFYKFRKANESLCEKDDVGVDLKANSCYLLGFAQYQMRRYTPSKKYLTMAQDFQPGHRGSIWLLKHIETLVSPD